MICPAIRFACALVALLLCIAAFKGGVLPAVGALLFILPLFAARAAPVEEERDAIATELARYRMAMIGCFAAAYVLLILAATTRGIHGNTRDNLAALGAALWIVAFLLLYPTAYYASRRRMLRDPE